MITLNLPPHIEAKLTAFAAAHGQDESMIAGQAVADFLEEMEDISLAESRFKEAGATLTLEQMRVRLLGDAQ